MITVTYYEKYHQVTVEGHANSAPKGEDLVCAGCSVLYHTLAANAMQWKDAGRLEDLRIKDVEGYAQVSWKPINEGVGCVLDVISEGIIRGFALLAADYPEYVTFHLLGESGGGVSGGDATCDTMGAG